MSLRTAILSAALPSLSRTSFTREALSSALASIPSHAGLDASARDGVIDTLFGPGNEGCHALVAAWEDEGVGHIKAGAKTVLSPTLSALAARLSHSASLGEHLVEAHALNAVNTTASIPLPPVILAALRARIPSVPLYRPPLPAALASSAFSHASAAASSTLDKTGGRLPLPTANPVAPLEYAWRVADATVYAARPHVGTGVMREPRGAGVEWYTSRVGIALAYLDAESYLLQPFEATPSAEGTNPYLPEALSALHRNMRRLDDLRGTARTAENATNGIISFIEEASRSVAGIIRSRGF